MRPARSGSWDEAKDADYSIDRLTETYAPTLSNAARIILRDLSR